MSSPEQGQVAETAGSFRPEDVPWLLRLRWSVMACQAACLLVMSLFFQARLTSVAHLGPPAVVIVLILVCEGAGNGVLHLLRRRGKPIATRVVAGFFLFDIILLAALLLVSGGVINPVLFLFAVHVVFAAMILPFPWALAVTIWSVLGSLAVCLPELGHSQGEQQLLHLQGFWLTFAVTTFFLAYFVGRIRQAAQESFRARQDLLHERARGERLASLTTLAAGAAHSLATPLATIAVAAGELRHNLESAADEVRDDVRLIRDQVALCKDILAEMAAGAGELRGEQCRRFSLREAMDEIVAATAPSQRSRLQLRFDGETHELVLPFRPFCRVVSSLINNALEASPAPAAVHVRWYDQEDRFCVEVVDHGTGMDSSVLRQATQPFFTTKESGMGLGLFLARTMAERHGGGVHLESRPGAGTTVVMSLLRRRITGEAWNRC